MDAFNQSRTLEVYGGTLSLILLATILVVARLIARKTSAANIWWDDFVSNPLSTYHPLSGFLKKLGTCLSSISS